MASSAALKPSPVRTYSKTAPKRRPKAEPHVLAKQAEMRAFAETCGLLAGPRTRVVRGRMPAELVAEAKRRTGIVSDSELLEAALVSIAVADEYGAWLFSQRGTIPKDFDLEF